VKCVNPDTRRFEYTDKFDTEWMTALVGIQEQASELSHFIRAPHRVDRDGVPKAPLVASELAFMFRQEFTASSFLRRLSDFNLLLYFAVNRASHNFSNGEILEMCDIVRSHWCGFVCRALTACALHRFDARMKLAPTASATK